MSFPTTLWGNTYDVYSTVPGPTASSPGSSDGPVLGNFAILADGTCIQFMQLVTATSTGAYHALKFSGSPASYLLTDTTAANQQVVAVNDLSGGSASNQHSATSGAAVTHNYCAWVTVRGLCFPLTLNGTAADAFVCSTGTAGQVATVTVGSDIQGNLSNLVLVGGSPASSPSFLG